MGEAELEEGKLEEDKLEEGKLEERELEEGKLEEGELEDNEVKRPYVWHDEEHYRRVRKRVALILAVAVIAGLVPYLLSWKNYTDGAAASILVFAVVMVILLAVFRRRLTDNMATYVSYEGELYRLADANRSITRIALDNNRVYEEFERDFARARSGNTSCHMLEVEQIKEKRKGYEIVCQVCLSKSGRQCQKSFFLEEGYQDMELLLEELRKLQKA